MIAVALGFSLAMGVGAPESVPESASEAPAAPEASATEVAPSGLVPLSGLQQTTGVWVPNTWPVQQTCDFLTVSRQACLTLGGEVFAGYRYRATAADRFNEFALDRAEVGTGMTYEPFARIEGGVVVSVEAVRSAGPQSLIGVDGDSLLVRMLETYGHLAVHASPIDIGIRAGLVPERWVQQVEKGLDTRGLAAIPSDDGAFYDRADIGATLTISGWEGLVEVDVEFVNGEGRAQKELNRGKNTTGIVAVRPLRKTTASGPMTLSILGAYRDGSIGIASLRNHRGSAAVTFASPWAYGGVEYAHAIGYAGRPDLSAHTIGAWASGHILAPWLGIAAAYEHTQQDLAAAASTVDLVSAGVFSDLFGYLDRNRRRLRLYAAYQYEGYGDAAGPLPGTPEAVDTHRFVLQLQARGLLRIW